MNTKPIILKVPAFEDFRGYLAVPYDKSVDFKICQINQGYSKKAFTLALYTNNSLQTIADTLSFNPMFNRFGLIDVPVKQDERRSNPTS